MHGSGSGNRRSEAAANIAHSIYLTHSTSLNRYKSTSKIPEGWTRASKRHHIAAIDTRYSYAIIVCAASTFRWIFAEAVCVNKIEVIDRDINKLICEGETRIWPMQWRVKSHQDMAWNQDLQGPTSTCCIHPKRMKLKCSSLAPSTIIMATLPMALAIVLAPK